MSQKKKIMCILAFELLILIVMDIMLIIQWQSSRAIDVPITDWESDYVEYDDTDGWFVNEQFLQSEESIDLIHSPLISLRRGTYRIKMEYHCDYNQSCLAYSNNDAFHLKAGEAILSKNYDQLIYDFEISGDIRDFEFLVRYNGNGYLQINDIDITPSPFIMLRNIFVVLGLFICADLCIFFSDRIKRNSNTLLALVGITILTSLPLFIDGIGNGHDLRFHLMRIEGIAREIRIGNIPVRISSAWMDGYGYPVSIYYGDLLLYIPAFMSLVGFSITSAYKFYIFMINIGTVVITYCCMNKICRDKRVALLMSLAYSTASYRMINIYERSAVGEYTAMMFMPIVAVAVYKIYTDDVSDVKEYRKNALLLAVGMSGLIINHVLSTEMIVFVMIIICISLFKLTFRKETVKVYLLAVLETCVLSAYFIVPFIDYSLNVSNRIGAVVSSGGTHIQRKGITIGEYFTFFRHMSHVVGSNLTSQRMLLTPGIILTMTFIIAIVLWINNRGNAIMKLLIVYACLTIMITLNIFPWDYLSSHFWVGNLLAQVQFPWRYIGIVSLILTVLLGNLLTQISMDMVKIEKYGAIIVAAGIVMTCFFTSDYADNSELVAPYSGAELDHYSVIGGEYLRDGTNIASLVTLTADVVSERMEEAFIVSRRGSSMMIRCVASDEEGGSIWIPMLNYKGYHVTDDDGNEYPIKDNNINQIEISVPIGFDGYLLVEYREPWYWRAAELVSLIAVLGLCVWEVWVHLTVGKYSKT